MDKDAHVSWIKVRLQKARIQYPWAWALFITL